MTVELGTRGSGGKHAAGDDRLAPDGWRIVALVGDRDQLAFQAQGADDLCRAGQQGRDAHYRAKGTKGLRSISSSMVVTGP
jgi:hypothetical protein